MLTKIYAPFIVAIATLGIMLVLVISKPAEAHDHWINRGNYISPIDGVHCCGPNDCFEVPDSDVIEEKGGFTYKPTGEHIPYSYTFQSEDGKFWRCKRPSGDTRCFFYRGGQV